MHSCGWWWAMYWDSASPLCTVPPEWLYRTWESKVQLWQMDFQIAFTEIFPFHIKKHELYTLLSMLTFHNWYPHIFSLSLDKQGWELRCPFQTKRAFFFSISECWLQQIYLAEFYLFSKFLCRIPNAVPTKCWGSSLRVRYQFGSMISIFQCIFS